MITEALFLPEILEPDLLGQSRHSGLVIDVGASQTTVVPVIEGNVMHRQVVSVHIGGEFILDSTRRWVSDSNLQKAPL